MSRAARARTSQPSSSSPAARGGGPGAAGGQHRGDQGVEGAEVVEQVGRGVAQRGGEDRHADAARRVDGVGQRLDVRGVPGGVLGAVEEDADPRRRALSPSSVGSEPSSSTPGRLLGRRLEALAGQQHGVGQEGVQLAQVLRAALGQVDVGLRGDPDRHGGELHQRGVRGLLAAEHDHRLARAADPGEAGAQALRRAEDPGHDQVARPRTPRPSRCAPALLGLT